MGTVYIVMQSQGQWSDSMTFSIKAFSRKDVAETLVLRLDESERLARISTEADGEYMEYSHFYVNEVEFSDIAKLRA